MACCMLLHPSRPRGEWCSSLPICIANTLGAMADTWDDLCIKAFVLCVVRGPLVLFGWLVGKMFVNSGIEVWMMGWPWLGQRMIRCGNSLQEWCRCWTSSWCTTSRDTRKPRHHVFRVKCRKTMLHACCVMDNICLFLEQFAPLQQRAIVIT